jgi:hypothetical protein
MLAWVEVQITSNLTCQLSLASSMGVPLAVGGGLWHHVWCACQAATSGLLREATHDGGLV